MNNTFTKGETNRLGDKIRNEEKTISDETLHELQNYRTSHKESLSEIFNTLCSLKKKINGGAIVTYRIKRFESIINKLSRYPKMQFSRMWDIAGCRIILDSEKEIYRLKEEIGKVLTIRKEYDYIAEPQANGYKSLHLFVSLPNDKTVVEVQLRNIFYHNWATLVEISDLIFDAGLKEYGRDKHLLRFHFLLSKETLSIIEKKEFSQIIRRYKYFEHLSKVFMRNYLKVREQWLKVKNQPKHNFFLIETTKNKTPQIHSFEKFSDAENQYFHTFKTNSDANVVLTHLTRASYKEISTAYSNYILTVHHFFDYSLSIIENLAIESLKEKKYRAFVRHFDLYNNIVYNHVRNMIEEVSFAREVFVKVTSKSKRKKKVDRKNKEWSKDIQNQLDRLIKNEQRLNKSVIEITANTNYGKVRVKRAQRKVQRKYQRLIEKEVAITQPKANTD